MFQKANRHILSFDFFKALILSLVLGAALYWGYKTNSYTIVFAFASGAFLAYFPNIEGSQRHRVIGLIVGFSWSFFILICQLLLFRTPQWVHFGVMMIFIFTTSMISVYGLRGNVISFGGLFAVVMSYGLNAVDLTFDEKVMYVLIGGVTYILVSGISQFFYQSHHIQSVLADCVELTAEYLEKLEQQVWEEKDYEEELLGIESQLNASHELLRSILLNRQGRLLYSNKTRRQYLIFRELIDLYEITLAENHDSQQVLDHYSATDAIVKPFREFTKLLVEEFRRFNEELRLNQDFKLSPKLRAKLLQAEESIKPLLKKRRVAESVLILQNLFELNRRQLDVLLVIGRHYENIVVSDTIIPKRDPRFITMQDYSYKILLDNLNFKSSIFRHSIRLCVAIAICFLIQDLIHKENTSWIIVTAIVVLRPNYGLTKSRAFDRVGGTLVGAISTLLIIYLIDSKEALVVISVVTFIIGFSYASKRYFLASMYITLSIMLLYVIFTNRTFDLVLNRVYYTFLGTTIALLTIYFIFPVWERESVFTSIRRAIYANRRYLMAVNDIYETKEAPDTEFKLIRKEAFVKNGNLYEAFQRLSEDPKSKRSQLSNSYAVVLLSHSTLKAIAAFSTYIQFNKTTEVSEEFKSIMAYILDQMRVSANIMEDILNSETKESKPAAALEKLDRYYYELSELRELELESGEAKMSYELSLKLQEGKVILSQIKTIKSLAENTLQLSRLLKGLPT